MKPNANCSMTNLQESEATQYHDQLDSHRKSFAKTQQIDVIVSPQVVHGGHLMETAAMKHSLSKTKPDLEKKSTSLLEGEQDQIVQNLSSRSQVQIDRGNSQKLHKLLKSTGRNSEHQDSADLRLPGVVELSD